MIEKKDSIFSGGWQLKYTKDVVNEWAYILFKSKIALRLYGDKVFPLLLETDCEYKFQDNVNSGYSVTESNLVQFRLGYFFYFSLTLETVAFHNKNI